MKHSVTHSVKPLSNNPVMGKSRFTLALAVAVATCLCLSGLATAWAQDETSATAAVEQVPAVAINPLKTRDELQAAYQKEYAFLDAQLKDLRARQVEFAASSSTAQRDKQASIDRIEGEYIAAQTRSDRINEMLEDAERQVSAAEDSRNTLEATFLQAGSTLENLDQRPINESDWNTGSDSEKIAALFGLTLDLLKQQGALRKTTGDFFLADGTQVNGAIIRIGNIAAYGLTQAEGEEQGGALAPAGEGRLKVWSASTPATAEALARGEAPAVLDIFLYESSQKAIEEQAGKTLFSVIQSGGVIAWIIVGLGVVAAILILLRFVFLRNASASTERAQQEVGSLVAEGKLEAALKACKQLKGSTSRVLASAVRNLERDRAHIEDIISEQILHESAHLNRFGAFIIVIAAVAPLLGLLGTVTGMISTFDIITEFGTGDPKLLSGGISIALVTTEVGLAVAIPALIFGNLLSGWAESIKDEMEKAALHVINLYTSHSVAKRQAA
ncbi:MAG: MotA/TolQ/ExbB proton channel family protein [Xanthomonadales bacterium]|nr:MotA/TolQ/ExbB proton channel family protein [Xanthomonadales bacterium]